MADALPVVAVAERLADAIARVGVFPGAPRETRVGVFPGAPGDERIHGASLPRAAHDLAHRLLIDVVGLCLVARQSDYVAATLSAWPDAGPATVIGHLGTRSAAAAAFINGTAAHGEDFDDTFEGGPVHAGAVIVPAVMAAAEDKGCSGPDVLAGILVGVETICRLSLVIPKAVHTAGFHPTAVFGTMAAAAAVARALRLTPKQTVDSLGIAGSMAGGIIEYLAEGAWTKRMHPGWAAQSGLRAAYLGQAGFTGPRTVFEGVHGLFNGFANGRDGDWAVLLDDFGTRWIGLDLAFKPYPCGTMTHPYIDCALRLRAPGLDPASIADIRCEAAAGTVHRLWEPLGAKQAPPNGYAAKFSQPYCIAAALVHGEIGLSQFDEAAVRDSVVLEVARKIRYEIDPANPYPHNYTGHIAITLADGRVLEERQPHLRGGRHEALDTATLIAKFRANARFGGWDDRTIDQALATIGSCFDRPLNMSSLRR